MKTQIKQGPYYNEISDFLSSLINAGFSIHSVDNGEYRCAVENNVLKAAEQINATDESYLFVSHPNYEKKLTIFIVLGNSHGELCSDYSDRPELSEVCEAHYNKWEGREVQYQKR